MPTRRGTALLIFLLASATVSCGGGDDSIGGGSPSGIASEAGSTTNPQLLGKWKRLTETAYGQDQVEFTEGGACVLQDSTQALGCQWSGLPEGKVEVRFGAATATGSITGDQLSLDHEDGTKSSWLRVGSQEDKNSADYFEGLAAIQSGNFMAGISRWQRAADQGHDGAQNSLAWLHAADRNSALHDGKKAVAYAEKATASKKHYVYLDTLAAALARDGQFDKAVKVEQQAIALLEKATDRSAESRDAALQRFRRRLALYMSGQPYADS